jgi:acetyl-CoA synthetase
MSKTGVYDPSEEFVRQANVRGIEGYRDLYRRAEQDPEAFWGDIAEREIHWFQKWTRVLDWNPPFAQWFAGAKTNVSYNCLDRHVAGPRKNKVAILWEGEPGEQRAITYQELLRLVSRFATVLKSRGYQAGDRAVIYMPMIPELPIAMLACARLGIIHSVVFGGFSAEARGRRGAARMPRRPRCDRLPAHRLGGRHASGTRFLVARARCRTQERRSRELPRGSAR